jgi:hypothetical protein
MDTSDWERTNIRFELVTQVGTLRVQPRGLKAWYVEHNLRLPIIGECGVTAVPNWVNVMDLVANATKSRWFGDETHELFGSTRSDRHILVVI